MFKKLLVLAVVFGFCVCNAGAEQISSTWVGDNGLWSEPTNWSPAIVPDNDANTFAVTIDSNSIGVDEVNIGLQKSRTIDQLDCYGTTVFSPMTPYRTKLTFADVNGLTNSGDMEIWEIKIDGDVKNLPGSNLILGAVDIEGDLHNHAGATLEIDCIHETLIWGGELRNAGLTKVYEHFLAEYKFQNTGRIELFINGICSTGIFDNSTSGVIIGSGAVVGEAIQNKGVIYASGGPLVVHSDSSLTNTGILGNKPLATLHIKPAVDVSNFGTIESNLRGGVVFDCKLFNEPNAIITLHNGALAALTITQSADAMFKGFGGITGDVQIEPGGLIELTGPTNVFGDVTIPADATLRISDGQTLITGHTTCEGTIHLIGGTVIFQGGCDCNECNIINEAGIDRNHFDVNADGAVNLEDYASFAASWLWESSWY